MTEILLQSALAVSKSKQLIDEVAQIRQKCAADHNDEIGPSNTTTATSSSSGKPIIECPDCFEKLLEAVRSRYLNSTDHEWFSSRRAFLQELDTMCADAKEYQLDPRAIDDRIQEERSRWYAENVRSSLLRLMVGDPAGREAVFEKLEDPPSDFSGLARDIAGILRKGLASPEAVREFEGGGGGGGGGGDIPARLLAAQQPLKQLEVLREAFFAANRSGADGARYGAVPKHHQKYFDMLKDHRSMEHVVERVLEERQAATGAREQTSRLRERLDELRRARAAHELQKSRKLKNRESFEQKIPDELYDLPPCAVCGQMPSTRDFLCCPICTILVRRNVQDHPTVYCSPECEHKGHTRHTKSHTCASGGECIQLVQDEDHPMGEDGLDTGSEIYFCNECMDSIKLPTVWCSIRCADTNFLRHRGAVHLHTRKRADRDRLDHYAADSETGYHTKDIAANVTPFSAAVKAWEDQTMVRLQN
ncbi:hypothetical protein B0T24DRAFT_605449 [Lasiosphaeria ovina]|uniref:Suppressor of anucleate metulae protein B n=1 Tax=Lasiosphaeria ovina TaxID=92902 RepID=A0AAE0NL56_9PEZI|nr:hypothetical protein B0T24DRAFT_605449 [Lasiosphaeria ovina]